MSHTTKRQILAIAALAATSAFQLGSASAERIGAPGDGRFVRRERLGAEGARWQHDVRILPRDTWDRDELDRHDAKCEFDRQASVDPRQFDRNHDGRLDRAERPAYWRRLAEIGVFGPSAGAIDAVSVLAEAFDENADGRLTAREMRLVRRFVAAREMFDAMDRDADRRVTRREAHGWIAASFASLDRNGDRAVTRQEVRGYFIRTEREDARRTASR